jgi:YggT family protein
VVDITITAISYFTFALTAAIFIQALMSWFVPLGSGNSFMILLNDLTTPILNPIRRVIPPIGGLDLSPMVAILVLQLLVRPLLIDLVHALAGS